MLYKDDIYIDDLIDSYMALEPIYRRSNKYTEAKINQKVFDIIDFKNSSLTNVKLYKNNIKYKVILDYINKKYNQKWIIPVVKDNKIIYSKLIIDNDDNNNNNSKEDNLILSDTQLKEDIKIIKQKEQFERLKTNEKNFNKNKQNFKSYLNKKINIIEDYSTDNINEHLKISSNLIRISEIDNIHFKQRIGIEPIENYKEIINEETNELIRLKKMDNPLYKGDKINLTGFLILPFGSYRFKIIIFF